MDSNYLQQQRYLLQKRVKRLNSCDPQLFHGLFLQFWAYLREHPLYSGLMAKFAAEAPAFADELAGVEAGSVYQFDSAKEAADFNFRLLEYCASQPLDGYGPEIEIGQALNGGSRYSEMLDSFREEYLEPFYDLLDESLDGQALVLSMLLKYKRHVEWFERETVRALTAKGERVVAKHLYSYLFDQGLEFHIEPQSVSGEADLVAPEFVADAKLFDGNSSGHGKRYLLNGVNQVLTYTRDYLQQAGYLVVYRSCEEDLQFSFARSDMLVPFLVVDGRVIYFLIVDVCDYSTSASKRGTLKTHLISEAEIRTVVQHHESAVVTADPAGASTSTLPLSGV